MKKIIVLVISFMFLVGGFGSKKILEKKISNDEVDDLKIVEVLENKELSDEVSAEKQVQDEIVIDSSTSEIKAEEVKTENVEETKKTTNSSKNNTSNTNNQSQSTSNSISQQNKTQPAQNNQPVEQPKQETKPQETPKEQPQKNTISTTFYDSITHGRKEFKSESEAIARGDRIVDNELNYVLDWNEAHPNNQIQPTINYYRIYPSAIDENGQYWYYLHFFITSGEGQDDVLKSKF